MNKFFNFLRNYILFNYSLRKFIYLLFSNRYFYSSRVVNFFYDIIIKNKQKKFIKKPQSIEIELTSNCNVACSFCPHPTMKRTKGLMNIDLVKRIIDDCSNNNINDVLFCGFGEPLLDKRLPQIISYAKQKNIRRTRITTTGYLLNKELAFKLFSSGLDQIDVSLDAGSSEAYDRIRKIKTPLRNYDNHFTVLTTNIENIILMLKENNFYTKINLRFLITKNNELEIKIFSDKFYNMHKNISISYWFNLHNWGNALNISKKPAGIKKPCNNLWTGMVVRYNGDVSLCCLDYENTVVMGNLGCSSIYELWNNENYKRLRNIHNNNNFDKIPLCQDCHIPYLNTGQWL